MFCSTVSHSKRPPCWNTYPRFGSAPFISSPFNLRVPVCGLSSPAISLRSVVLPHPEAPIMEINSPFFTSKFTSERAIVSFSPSLYIRFTPFISRMISRVSFCSLLILPLPSANAACAFEAVQ